MKVNGKINKAKGRRSLKNEKYYEKQFIVTARNKERRKTKREKAKSI